jgi:RNA polymerase-binding transcription factor DksA
MGNKNTDKVTSKVEKKGDGGFRFPASLLNPIGNLLTDSLKKLERRKKVIETEDPFKDFTRLEENASPDTDAAEQFGHARTSAIKKELDKKIIQTRKALTRIKIGKYGICEDCSKMIDTDRLIVYPVATLCASCQKNREK